MRRKRYGRPTTRDGRGDSWRGSGRRGAPNTANLWPYLRRQCGLAGLSQAPSHTALMQVALQRGAYLAQGDSHRGD